MPESRAQAIVESSSEPTQELEEKYREQMRQILTQKIELPVSTLPTMLEKQIQLKPHFQRRERWDAVRQSRFIESLIMNVPIPPVFLGEDQYGEYVVLDGRQRLTAIAEFLRNTLKLRKLKVWSELNGKIYQDLVKENLSPYLNRRFVPAVVILKESSPVVKYDVFDRLNTGGVQANPMEIRNAVYPGVFTDSLRTWSRAAEFCRLWDIPTVEKEADKNKLYQSMTDVELVLRFFALSEYEKMNLRFKDYLSDYMDQRNKIYAASLETREKDQVRFLNAVRNCWYVFGNEAFRRTDKDKGSGIRSVPLADAAMIALADHAPNELEGKKEIMQRAFAELMKKENFSRAITAGTNGKGAIGTRIRLAREAVNDCLR